MEKRKKSYRNIFLEICNGYSPVKISEESFFVKHIDYQGQTLLDDLRGEYFDKARSQGLPTVQESLENLKEEGLWTLEQENELIEEESFVLKLIASKKNAYLKSRIDSTNEQIKKSQKKINELKNKRSAVLGNTCENHADQKITEDFIKFSFFKDRNCTIPAFSEGEFEELDVDEIMECVGVYNDILQSFSDNAIQEMVLEDFFSYYMLFSEDPIHFYGKPVIQLTYNQLRLILFARYFKNIFASNENIPEEFRKNPEKLIDYVNANEKAKAFKETEGKAMTIANATKEDYEYLGMNKGKNTKMVNLGEEVKKKGGSLNMQDLMNLMKEN